ncbi:MAG TPA: type II toxin-antitoxin system VapC family toxin [Gaiellaceae bacterium]|nr:type II toxin-antitoxin system VapC family toxin [Gaiellaceae bacterium]
MSFLLDTNVVSEIRKPNRNAGVSAWFEGVDSGDLYLSVLVVGEIKQGIERLRRRNPKQSDVFERWLTVLKKDFDERLLPVSSSVAERWGLLNSVRPLPVVDGLLAATAIEHDLTLVTRDDRTLAESGARLLNPWQERS